MTLSAITGYPRIGSRRELKQAVEGFWDGELELSTLEETARTLRLEAWQHMSNAGIDLIPSNTFSYYDHVLDAIAMVGAIPPRYQTSDSNDVDLETYFAMARGAQREGLDVTAMEMTKWFDTNYHYIVPELGPSTTFRLATHKALSEYHEAKAAGIETVPVLLGPLSLLLLGKGVDNNGRPAPNFDRLSLLPSLLETYEEAISELHDAGAQWLQLDEPVLVQDRSTEELVLFAEAYQRLSFAARDTKLLVQTYFGNVDAAFGMLADLPVAGIGLDLVRGHRNLELLQRHGLPGDKHVVAGVVDGRNIWINDLEGSLATLRAVGTAVGDDRVIIGTSCSLLHSPLELELETDLDPELRSWLAFANQKILEVATLARALSDPETVSDELSANRVTLQSRNNSPRTHNPLIRERLAATTDSDYDRSGNVDERRHAQRERLGLPLFPTTTIGSFPQTPEIRRARRRHNRGDITQEEYDSFLEQEIERVIRLQERIGLDVLVHGEAERNDMVEYFGEQLEGFAFTRFGWVQSYGSRNVKPPIIYGDVSRSGPMTVRWSKYAQSLTDKPVKGMLTGPITILNWSFVRDDQPRAETCRQIALAIRDEVVDLETAGISVIQVDEPALREGVPLRHADWPTYLGWAVPAFRLATAGVTDSTQIQSHMCYVALGDVLGPVSDMEADVMLLFNARSDAESLDSFRDHGYDKDVGLGVYDIHSPRIPPIEEMVGRLRDAATVLNPQHLWVNPDCGLKTRRYEETIPALEHLVEAARMIRDTS